MSDVAAPGQTVPYAVYQKALDESIRRKGTIRDLKKQVDDLTRSNGELKTSNDKLTKDVGDLDSRLKSDPSEKDAKIESLTTELRSLKHRSVFDRVAKGAKVREDALGDLWTALAYKPEADEADEAKITGLVTEALKGRGYMVQADPPAGGGAADAARAGGGLAAKPPGPGATRGGAQPTLPSDPVVRASEGLKAVTGRGEPFRIA